ncbi:Uma2 family endonuclease [Oscillatoria sp. FACHB-1406]|uniref:Uma2 family endonuclease n=1 Tax=Oscillatoria sp. FACHB-1406 TaxID=2692846 RepID=UPI0016860C0F|nr:Uma2 family endonuclease [Oscillatoria sp. FACHB-1406]MBD2579779.1 Uma2 family endonuclease [Oscillatoria sp. FACHB-1406]
MIALPAGFSPQDYLALERDAEIRHEYRQGLIYAMSGSSDDHDEICLNLIELLRQKLRDSGCAVRSGNVKVNYADAFFYYPDVFVTCDERDREDRYVKRYPKLIVEVLSPSTEKFDRAEKFEDYQQIPTLEEYVLINQDRMQVECRRCVVTREGEKQWETQSYGAGELVQFKSVELEVGIAQLYRGVSQTG